MASHFRTRPTPSPMPDELSPVGAADQALHASSAATTTLFAHPTMDATVLTRDGSVTSYGSSHWIAHLSPPGSVAPTVSMLPSNTFAPPLPARPRARGVRRSMSQPTAAPGRSKRRLLNVDDDVDDDDDDDDDDDSDGASVLDGTPVPFEEARRPAAGVLSARLAFGVGMGVGGGAGVGAGVAGIGYGSDARKPLLRSSSEGGVDMDDGDGGGDDAEHAGIVSNARTHGRGVAARRSGVVSGVRLVAAAVGCARAAGGAHVAPLQPGGYGATTVEEQEMGEAHHGTLLLASSTTHRDGKGDPNKGAGNSVGIGHYSAGAGGGDDGDDGDDGEDDHLDDDDEDDDDASGGGLGSRLRKARRVRVANANARAKASLGRRLLSPLRSRPASVLSAASQSTRASAEVGAHGGLSPQDDPMLRLAEYDDDAGATPRERPPALPRAAVRAARSVNTRHSLKRALIDLYRSVVTLRSFAVVNYTAFLRLIKKHDKLSRMQLGPSFMAQLGACTFAADATAPLTLSLEQLFAQHFADGDISMARATLLVRHHHGHARRSDFQPGFRLGIGLMLFFWVIWDAAVDWRVRPTGTVARDWIDATEHVWRGLGCMLLLLWCWGMCLYAWAEARVNHLHIFEFSPASTLDHNAVFRRAGSLTALFFGSCILFYKIVRAEALDEFSRPGLIPFALGVACVGHLLPVARWGVWRALKDVVTTPVSQPTFLTVFAANVLTSLTVPLVDLVYTACFFVTGDFAALWGSRACENHFWFAHVTIPAVCALPVLWRLLQNARRWVETGHAWPFAGNALKYACALGVVGMGAADPRGEGGPLFKAAWAVLVAVTALGAWAWDVYMDWGLGRAQHGGLRERLMYHRPAPYRAAIALDAPLCVGWVLSLIPHRSALLGAGSSVVLTTGIALSEVLRRGMWALFRLEYEHLHNTEGYRRVDFVPLHFETEANRYSSRSAAAQRTRARALAEVVIVVALLAALAALAYVSAKS